MKQSANAVLMIRPVAFRMNEQTAVNNYFQKTIEGMQPAAINAKAQAEFDQLVTMLRNAKVDVIVVDDLAENNTPDSIFPNHWISFHANSSVAIYPLFAENRRKERREDEILDALESKGFTITNIVDYTSAEADGYFLEGTGSMVLDRIHSKAYCALSPRADEELFIEFCEDFEFTPVIFEAFHLVGDERKQIYHTNVMMSVGENFAAICAETIDDRKERKAVLASLKEDGKEIILLTEAQVETFAGNMLEVVGTDGKHLIIMSATAYDSLTKNQIQQLEKHGEILASDLKTIETLGGGSARCMMAEIFLPKAK